MHISLVLLINMIKEKRYMLCTAPKIYALHMTTLPKIKITFLNCKEAYHMHENNNILDR